jgi:hypothetical protein
MSNFAPSLVTLILAFLLLVICPTGQWRWLTVNWLTFDDLIKPMKKSEFGMRKNLCGGEL